MHADTKTIACGSRHSLFIMTDGSLWAWGSNDCGQLGDGTTTNRSAPIQIGEDKDWLSVSAGDMYSTATKNDGSLWTWGSNDYGQLGDGTTINHLAPTHVGTDINAASHGDYNMWLLYERQRGYAWASWVSVSIGNNYTVAIRTDGSLWAWGDNRYGRLGDGTVTNQYKPILIWSQGSWRNVSVGYNHTLAAKADGTLWAWGGNQSGKLGDSTVTTFDANNNTIENNDKLLPIEIMQDVARAEAGTNHSLAIKRDGSLWAWGNNKSGQLGNGTNIDAAEAVKIMDDVVAAAAGNWHSIAIKTDGSLWAWGCNDNGQLGDGTNTDRNTPVKILFDGESAKGIGGERLYVTANDESRVFVRSKADTRSDIVFIINAGDKTVPLKGTGEKKKAEAYEWYEVALPDGKTGWVREDVVKEVEVEAKQFSVETGIRYYHDDPDYVFTRGSYKFTAPLTISIRFPAISKDTVGADSIADKIDEDFAWLKSDYADMFAHSDFSGIDEDHIAHYVIDYSVHQYQYLFALFIEYWVFGADWGGDYGGVVYYYDGKEHLPLDAEHYAKMAGFSKDDVVLSQNNNDPADYYQADEFEQVLFYVDSGGELFTTVGYSD